MRTLSRERRRRPFALLSATLFTAALLTAAPASAQGAPAADPADPHRLVRDGQPW